MGGIGHRTAMLKEASREMDCIYINGDAGTGETTYAKDLAIKNGYSVVSFGSNEVLDGYGGEDCIILVPRLCK
jgi:SpoVK/Ycf46/Vps4 family AAA+-type ATPase